MSRLDEECIMAVVRNRSGIDAGEIDYSLACARFDAQDVGSLEDIKTTLNVLYRKVNERIDFLNDKKTQEQKFVPVEK